MIALAILDLRSRRWGDYCGFARSPETFWFFAGASRLARDVVDSVQTRRSDFSGYSAPGFALAAQTGVFRL